jgi:hypothetical protein
LALERFRNLIETNIEAGFTLYTDYKPALFENSLSSKGQLSAWKLAEVAGLLSIVENLYRQGGKMLFADPLSRVCDPTEGWFDPSLPRKLAALFEYLPEEVRNIKNIRVYAGKDTYAAGRLVQRWRKPSNPISQGKLLTKDLAPDAFHIGVDDVNKCVNDTKQLMVGSRIANCLSLDRSSLTSSTDFSAWHDPMKKTVELSANSPLPNLPTNGISWSSPGLHMSGECSSVLVCIQADGLNISDAIRQVSTQSLELREQRGIIKPTARSADS